MLMSEANEKKEAWGCAWGEQSLPVAYRKVSGALCLDCTIGKERD